MSKTALDKSILDIISEPDSGSPEDKMRLFIIYYICSPHISEMDYHKFESALNEAGCDMHAMAYIKRWRYVPLHHVPNNSIACHYLSNTDNEMWTGDSRKCRRLPTSTRVQVQRQ